MREGEELKAPRHASAAATRDGNLPSRDGSLPYVTAICLIPDNIALNYPYNWTCAYRAPPSRPYLALRALSSPSY